MPIEINISAKKFLLAFLCSIALVDAAFDPLATILVRAPVDAGFSGGYEPINSI